MDYKDLLQIIKKSNGDYTSAIITTYSFDPVFIAEYLLPQLRKSGIYNVMFLVDAEHLDNAVASDNDYIIEAINEISATLVRIDNPTGCFHPKLIFLSGPNAVALCVGSGNMTFSSMLHNHEVWGYFQITRNDLAMLPLIKDAWIYINSLIPETASSIQMQKEWSVQFIDWWNNLPAISGWTDMEDVRYKIIYNSETTTIYEEIEKLIHSSHVIRMRIASPFYDSKGQGVLMLKEAAQVSSVELFIEPISGTIPYELLKKETNSISCYYLGNENGENKGEPMHFHSKLYQFDLDNGETILVYGSANASTSGLKLNKKYGNDEVCVVIHSTKQTDYFEELGFYSLHALTENDINKCVAEAETVHKVESKSTSNEFDFSILYAEQIAEDLFVKTNNPLIKGAVLKLLDYKLKAVETVSLDDFMGRDEFCIRNIGLNKVTRVYFAIDEKCCSNHCIITSYQQVENSNPDPVLAKLTSIKNRFIDEDDNLADLLEYMFVDEEEQDVFEKQARASFNLTKKDEGEVIDRRYNFNELVSNTESPSCQHRRHDLMIVELLKSLTRIGSKQDVDTGIEEIDEESEIEAETPPTITNHKSHKKAESNQTVSTIKDYFRRVERIYQGGLHPLVEGLEENCLVQSKGENEYGATIKDMTLCLVALFLVYKYSSILIDEENDSQLLLRTKLCNICNEYFLLVRGGKNNQHVQYKKKQKEYIIEVAALALWCISFFDWEGDDDDIDLRLWVYNTLDYSVSDGDDWKKNLLKRLSDLEENSVIECNTTARDFIYETIKTCGSAVPVMSTSYYSSSCPESYEYIYPIGYYWRSKVDTLSTDMRSVWLYYPGLMERDVVMCIEKFS